MNPKQLVKNKILLNKIAEYFAKNPKKDSVVIKADFGESKCFWRAVRESATRFAITEVKTVTDAFIFEVRNSKAQPAAKGLKKSKAPAKAKVDPSKKEAVKTKNPADKKPVVAEKPKPLMTIQMVTQQ